MSDPFGQGGSPANPWGSPQPADPTQPPTSYPPQQGQPSGPQYPGYQGPQSGQFNQPAPQTYPGYTADPSQQPAPGQFGPGMPPYGQPAAPSQPVYPYGQPIAPSQPLSGFGQPGMPSQMPTMAGQFSQPLMYAPGPAAPKKSRTGLWIGLAIVVVILAGLGGGGLWAFSSYAAPAAAAVQFCDALKGQNYDTAYSLLSPTLRQQYTKDQFSLGTKTLDTVEGNVTACKQAASGAYSYSLGASTATVNAVISRGKQGELSGALHLKNDGGAWKVDAIDTALLGVNLDALKAAFGFCSAMQAKDYTTAYALVSSDLKDGPSSQSDLSTAAGLWDGIEGPITGCTLTALGATNTDTSASFTVSVVRSKATHTGAVTLAKQGGAWKLTQLDNTLLGPDLTPLITGITFCTAIQQSQYPVAFALLSANWQSSYGSVDNFKQDWGPDANGITVAGCSQPVLDSYKVSSSDASYDGGIIVERLSDHKQITDNRTFLFVKEGNAWKLDDVKPRV